MKYTYGHFNEMGDEFIITTPQTPRAFDSFLWNDAVFSNVQQTGVGYLDYQIDKQEGIQLFTGIGRICDFDTFGREHLMNRLIYVRDNDTSEFWNVNWEPACKPYENFECLHGMGYTTIKNETNGIECTFKIFIPKGNDPVELWSVEAKNISDKPRNISLFVYNQFQFKYKWGFDSYGDMIYRTCYYNKKLNALVAVKHPFRKPHNYLTGFMAADEKIIAFDGSRDAFVGVYSSLNAPQAVVGGKCSNTPGSADATIGAIQFDIALSPSKSKRIEIIVGATDQEENISVFTDKYLNRFDNYFNELRTDKNKMLSLNTIHTPDEHLNRILNYWVKQAASYGATWCRWGWNGYRDIVQHGLGATVLEPKRTRDILLEALSYQYSNGLAVRGWNPLDEKPYSDSALWLVFTLTAYLKETGDLELLNENVPFYDEGSATVLRHIEIALNFLEQNKGANDLILIKFGDWNDSLTGIGKEGRGESVWLSIAYAEALRQMQELYAYQNKNEDALAYGKRRKDIIKAINSNAWDGKWYTRCFDDNGDAVGSHENKFAKIFLEPQSWALIAGVADEERAETLLRSCDEILSTDVGYLLLAPPFTEVDSNIGRISSMEPGIAENGTVYSHLNIWMILGLLRYGKADKAYDILKRITPGYVSDADDRKQRCPSYMYSNCYFGPDHKNNQFQMEFTWITGSVAWYNTVILNEMLGAMPNYNGLEIKPAIPTEWETCSVKRHFRGADYNITIMRSKDSETGIVVDGKKIAGNILPVFGDGKLHQVDVTISC